MKRLAKCIYKNTEREMIKVEKHEKMGIITKLIVHYFDNKREASA